MARWGKDGIQIADDGPAEDENIDDPDEDSKADRAADEYERNFWGD